MCYHHLVSGAQDKAQDSPAAPSPQTMNYLECQ